MVTLALFQRMEGRDYLLGDVTFPVKPRSEWQEHQAPDEAWLTPSTTIESSSPQPTGAATTSTTTTAAPRLLIRWRTFPSREPQALPRITADSIDAAVASRNVETLQREILKAKEEIAQLRDQSVNQSGPLAYHNNIPSLNTSQDNHPLYTAPSSHQQSSSAQPFQVQVFVSLTGRIITFHGTQNSRVSDVCRFAATHGLGPNDAARYPSGFLNTLKLFHRNEALVDHEVVSRVVSPQDVLLLQPVNANDSFVRSGVSASPNGLNQTPRPEGELTPTTHRITRLHPHAPTTTLLLAARGNRTKKYSLAFANRRSPVVSQSQVSF